MSGKTLATCACTVCVIVPVERTWPPPAGASYRVTTKVSLPTGAPMVSVQVCAPPLPAAQADEPTSIVALAPEPPPTGVAETAIERVADEM